MILQWLLDFIIEKSFSLCFVGSYILRLDHAAGFILFLARMNIHLEVAIRIIYIHNLSLMFSFGYTHRHHGDHISITLLSVFPPYQGHTYTPNTHMYVSAHRIDVDDLF